MKSYKTAVIGASGYSGTELVTLLNRHPHIEEVAVVGRNESVELPVGFLTRKKYTFYDLQTQLDKITHFDCVFLATPVEVSAQYAAQLLDLGLKIIDLSGYFRVSPALFEQFYGHSHSHPHLIEQACYGLQPFCRENFTQTRLIANPGCYATAVLMALWPLHSERLLTDKTIIIDARSGTSGGGKKANESLMFSEVNENFFPYKIGKHQHTAEILHYFAKTTHKVPNFTLTTHILPVTRGISLSIYCSIKRNNPLAIENAYQKSFKTYPFAHIHALNSEEPKSLHLNYVVHTPNTHINYCFLNNEILFINCNIDNLQKGAASQAIENMNMMFDLPVDTGLRS